MRSCGLRGRVAMIMVEHHAEMVLPMVDRAYVLVNGQVAYEGSARALEAERGVAGALARRCAAGRARGLIGRSAISEEGRSGKKRRQTCHRGWLNGVSLICGTPVADPSPENGGASARCPAPGRRTAGTPRMPETRPCRRRPGSGSRTRALREVVSFPAENRQSRRPKATDADRWPAVAGRGSCAMPMGVALTRPVAAAMAAAISGAAVARSGPNRPVRFRARLRARSGSASTMASRAAPPSEAAHAPRPRPRRRRRSAPRSPDRHPAGRDGSLRRNPRQSVLWPTRRPSESTTVLTAPIATPRRQLVQQRHHRLLARVRHVEAVEAHPFGRQQQIGKRRRGQLEPLEIDQPVDAAQAMLRRFLLVHTRACAKPGCPVRSGRAAGRSGAGRSSSASCLHAIGRRRRRRRACSGVATGRP